MTFARIFQPPPFYDPPQADEFLLVCGAFALVILFFRLIQFLAAEPSTSNDLNPTEENKVVSPFLINEFQHGEAGVYGKRKKLGLVLLAIVLAVIVFLTPLADLLD